ncbi:RNA 2',3'-cyclic phosphodiesterase [soil metagenome]
MPVRAFVAIFPPEKVQKALLRDAQLVPVSGNIRWVQPANVHLTLKFLGDVSSDRLEGVKDALASVARRYSPLRIQPCGLGAFPSIRKARVLWAGVDEGSTTLSGLAEDVEDVLEPLGFERESKRYRPHLALGRIRGRPGTLPEGARTIAPAFTASCLDLVQSQLDSSGATYTKLESFELTG